VVLGPVVAQDGIVYAHNYDSDPHGTQEFLDYYLVQMATASAQAGMPLLDALDVHYYTVGTADPAQCVQNPRLFWDPNYTDLSAASVDAIDFAWQGNNNYFDTAWYPRIVAPRLLRKIAAAYGRSGPGLVFSEYNSGCETTIAGGLAEADDLGVFGREGVFAAAAMPEAALSGNYLVAAYDLYRNYDGNGTVVGDTSVGALTNDVEDTSVYAFAHSDSAAQMEVVAINKATAPAPATVQILHAHSFGKATAYQLTGNDAAVAPVQGSVAVMCSNGSCTFESSLPPMSATTFVLR
jgi:mannan endo-1,4-beta-mannosidase